MLLSHGTGSIDFMGCPPLYQKRGIPKAFLDKAMGELLKDKEISITTYREGDRADTGQRREIQGLGFADIAEIGLERVIDFEPERDPLEGWDEAWMERARFKSALEFVGLMDHTLQRFRSGFLHLKLTPTAPLRRNMFVMPAKNTLEWEDVFPFLYLRAAFEGIKESGVTRHLAIDEMQDYTPIQYAVINLLFPCPKTIPGDFGQRLNPCHSYTLEDLRHIYRDAGGVSLTKSCRSTYEIMTFAKRIQNISALEPVERHGEEPALEACENDQDEIAHIKKAIRDFTARGNNSLGIILKTNKSAKAFYDVLSGEYAVNLISPESTSLSGGISAASVQMAKGLEFDEVVVPQMNRENYSDDYDRSLLYIACTRAMYRLTLLV